MRVIPVALLLWLSENSLVVEDWWGMVVGWGIVVNICQKWCSFGLVV